MNKLFDKVLDENEKCVLYFYLKTEGTFWPIPAFNCLSMTADGPRVAERGQHPLCWSRLDPFLCSPCFSPYSVWSILGCLWPWFVFMVIPHLYPEQQTPILTQTQLSLSSDLKRGNSLILYNSIIIIKGGVLDSQNALWMTRHLDAGVHTAHHFSFSSPCELSHSSHTWGLHLILS